MDHNQTPHAERGFMPDKLAQFEKDLDSLESFLKRATAPVTARQIIETFECSKQAGYFRIKELKKRLGDKLKTVKVREGLHGPWSKGYVIDQTMHPRNRG